MPGPVQSRQLGTACRIYKNAESEVLALDDITVNVDHRKVGTEVFHSSPVISYKRTLLHLGSADRTIAEIQMIGTYSSLTKDSGNFLTATWTGWWSNSNNRYGREWFFSPDTKL